MTTFTVIGIADDYSCIEKEFTSEAEAKAFEEYLLNLGFTTCKF